MEDSGDIPGQDVPRGGVRNRIINALYGEIIRQQPSAVFRGSYGVLEIGEVVINTCALAHEVMRVLTERWRPEVAAFADLMERELRLNDHKGGWANEPPGPLMDRLWEEAHELSVYFGPGSRTNYDAWSAQIGAEAADVANFAMMIADVCGALRPADTTDLQASPGTRDENLAVSKSSESGEGDRASRNQPGCAPKSATSDAEPSGAGEP